MEETVLQPEPAWKKTLRNIQRSIDKLADTSLVDDEIPTLILLVLERKYDELAKASTILLQRIGDGNFNLDPFIEVYGRKQAIKILQAISTVANELVTDTSGKKSLSIFKALRIFMRKGMEIDVHCDSLVVAKTSLVKEEIPKLLQLCQNHQFKKLTKAANSLAIRVLENHFFLDKFLMEISPTSLGNLLLDIAIVSSTASLHSDSTKITQDKEFITLTLQNLLQK